jgi:hypothetical protein
LPPLYGEWAGLFQEPAMNLYTILISPEQRATCIYRSAAGNNIRYGTLAVRTQPDSDYTMLQPIEAWSEPGEDLPDTVRRLIRTHKAAWWDESDPIINPIQQFPATMPEIESPATEEEWSARFDALCQ